MIDYRTFFIKRIFMMTCRKIKSVFFAAVLILPVLFIAGCSDSMKGQSVEKIRFEHAAINVKEPVAMADWYCKNLGMTVVFKADPPANTRFVKDASGKTRIELYNNSAAPIPDYASQDLLVLHFAFNVDDVKATCDRLIKAGAKMDKDVTVTASGDEIATIRDPWGIALQFVKRAKPMK
jgi:glyoxylase I family protein